MATQVNSRVELISQAEYARRRGVAKSAVAKAVSEGRITLINGKLDPSVADIQWAQNTRVRVGSTRSGGHVSDLGQDLLSGQSNAGAGTAPEAGSSKHLDEYTEAKTQAAKTDAARSAHELAKSLGEHVEKSRTSLGAFDAARELRDAMDSSVHTLAAELAGLDNADACARVLRQHNRAIQELLAKRLRERMALEVASS